MSGTLWYVCLAAIGLGTSIFIMLLKWRPYGISTLITLYLFATGITWIGEYVVLGFFNGYAYKTGLNTDVWAQNLIGHLLLNTTMWPAAALLIACFSLGYAWYPAFAAAFILPEYLFIRLGIYEQHWWRYYMSGIIVLIFFSIIKKWFVKIIGLKQGISGSRATRGTVFFFVAIVILHIATPLLLLFGKQRYSVGFINKLIKDMYLSSTIFAFGFHLVLAFLVIIFFCILKKWYWKLVPFTFPLIFQGLFSATGILVLQNGWRLVYTILINSTAILVLLLIEEFSLKPGIGKKKRKHQIG